MHMSPAEYRARLTPSKRNERAQTINLGIKRGPRPVRRARQANQIVMSHKTYGSGGHVVGGGSSLTPHAHHQGKIIGTKMDWSPVVNSIGVGEGNRGAKEPSFGLISAGEAGKMGHLQMGFIPGMDQPGLEDAALGRCPFKGKPFTVVDTRRKNHVTTVAVKPRPWLRQGVSLQGLGIQGPREKVISAEIEQLQRRYDAEQSNFDAAKALIAAENVKSFWQFPSAELVASEGRKLSQARFNMMQINADIRKASSVQAARNAAIARAKTAEVTKDLESLKEKLPAGIYKKAAGETIDDLKKGIAESGKFFVWLSKNKKLVGVAALGFVALSLFGKRR